MPLEINEWTTYCLVRSESALEVEGLELQQSLVTEEHSGSSPPFFTLALEGMPSSSCGLHDDPEV